jgi:surface polysaccharide O-acyltransferase-like enzyme
MSEVKNRIFWLDLARAIAICGVVWIHSIVPLLYDYDQKAAPNWWVGNVYDSFMRMSVPLFVMITGALLLERDDKPISFLWKRLPKLIVPLFVWGLVYKYISTEGFSFSSVGPAMLELLQGDAHFHLWFMYMIIGLYFVIPLLQALISNATNQIHYYFIAVWFLAVSALPLIARFADVNIYLELTFNTGYTGYLVLGYVLSKIPLDKKLISIAIAVYLLSVCATGLGNFALTYLHKGFFDGYFREYLSPTVIAMSASAFILIRSLGTLSIFKKSQVTPFLISNVSDASYGIYLSHIIFLTRITNDFAPFTRNPIYMVPLNWLITILLSFLLVLILKRIPGLKYAVP